MVVFLLELFCLGLGIRHHRIRICAGHGTQRQVHGPHIFAVHDHAVVFADLRCHIFQHRPLQTGVVHVVHQKAVIGRHEQQPCRHDRQRHPGTQPVDGHCAEHHSDGKKRHQIPSVIIVVFHIEPQKCRVEQDAVERRHQNHQAFCGFQIKLRTDNAHAPRQRQEQQPCAADKAPEGAALEFRQRLFCSNALQDNVDHQRHQQEFHQEKAQAGVLYPEQIVLRGDVPVFSVYQAVHQEEVQSDQHQRSGADCRDQCRQICLGDAQPEQRTVVVHGVERLDVAHGEKADAVDHYRKGHENGKAFPACEPEHSAVKHHKQRQNRINRHVKARKNNHRQNGHPLPPGMFFIGQEIEEQHHQHRQKSLSQRRLCHPDHHRRCRRRCTRKGCAAPAQLQIPAEEEHQENGAAVKYGLHILHLCHAEQLSPHRQQ